MSLRTPLRRLEETVGDPGCPACRDRRGYMVMMTAHRLPDGTTQREDGAPAPCEQCGVVPEFVIEIAEAVVRNREDVDAPPARGCSGPA